MYMYMYYNILLHKCISVCAWSYMYMYMYMYICMYMPTYIFNYACTKMNYGNIPVSIQVYTFIYVHVYTCTVLYMHKQYNTIHTIIVILCRCTCIYTCTWGRGWGRYSASVPRVSGPVSPAHLAVNIYPGIQCRTPVSILSLYIVQDTSSSLSFYCARH